VVADHDALRPRVEAWPRVTHDQDHPELSEVRIVTIVVPKKPAPAPPPDTTERGEDDIPF
jgi:hypothetical protein